MLGVDWELANGAYRIKHIVRGGPWDSGVASPLDEPGVNVKEGEYVLAVNGVPLDPKADPWASFADLGKKTVVLTVNSTPSMTKARQVVVTCLDDETELRFRSWIEDRRQIVDKATGGKVGYIYVQSTGTDAQNELMRQFMAQWKKDGADHRRALEQRRPDSGSLHRAAEPADPGVLGGARRRAASSGRRSRIAARR